MELRFAVVEDRLPDAQRLESLLRLAFGGGQPLVCDHYESGDAFLQAFPSKNHQVVFLDICMEGTNGIETARILRRTDPDLLLVFVTSSPEYVWDAFPVHPFDYLLKPYREEKLFQLADELRRVLFRAEPELEVRIARQQVHLPLRKIQYAMAQNHYVRIVSDDGGYLIQSSYSFVDGRNLIVCPTSHNHVLMLRATDENGTPLPVFEKVLDINIKEAAERVLGRSLEQNLLSIVFDYDGNLWFVTGGFRIYPSRGQQGAMGYISHNAIDAILAGGTADLDHEVHVYAPAPGEGAENGIASCREGAVILTNLACYLLRANGGVEVVWRTPYDSVGAKDSREGAATTGGGLAWGGGCSPSLSRELVFFTDNLETVSLMAVDIRTGEVAASHPVIDELPANMPVSVENSAIVYDHGNGRVSTIVCNWFGAGSPNLAKPDSDSSIQSYENIYDRNWLLKGNCMIMPGVERVDTIRTADGWTMKSVWCRDDLSDTSMMKLSTATGYIYGFVQDVDSGMWQYIVLDFDTGKTVLTVDVASLYGYNNMAIGMYAGRDGNKLYCPTGYKELLRLQDRFVFLPEMPYRKVDLDKTSRRVLSAAEFQAAGGAGTPASWLHTATLDNLHPATTVSFRINGLTGNAADYKLFALGTDGRYHEVSDWHFDDAPARLSAKKVYTICLTAQDGGSFDLSPDAKEVTLSIVLAR